MSEIKLKPCPFCGGEAKLLSINGIEETYYFVHCTKCSIEQRAEIESAFYAAEQWNHRVRSDK